MQAYVMLFHWGSYRWAHNLWILIIYLFFLLVMLPSVVPRLASLGSGSASWCLETSLCFKIPFLGWSSIPTSFVSLLSFFFFLPTFEDNELLFWVPDVICWHSVVVLWNLLSVQMFF